MWPLYLIFIINTKLKEEKEMSKDQKRWRRTTKGKLLPKGTTPDPKEIRIEYKKHKQMLNEEQESEDRKLQPVRISFIPTEKHLFFPSTVLKKRSWDNKLWKLCMDAAHMGVEEETK